MPAKLCWSSQCLSLWFTVEFISLNFYKNTHNFFLWHTYKPHSDIYTNTHTHTHTHTIIAALFIQLALLYAEAENRNKASICFIDQTWKKWHHLLKNNNFEALPTEWKPINKNCIILQLNGTVIKNSSFNGFQWGHFCTNGAEWFMFLYLV